MSSKNRNFKKRLGFALAGFISAVRRESSLKVHCFAVVGLAVFSLWAQPPWIWCAAFTGIAALVLSLEILNSAMEALIDKLHPGQDSEIGFAKDALAGAVLVASIAALLIFGFYLLEQAPFLIASL